MFGGTRVKRFGLIGHPLGHSMSPLIHTRIMEMAGIDGTYALFDIEPARLHAEAPRLMRELDGFNCTIPHKEKIAEMLAVDFPVNTVFRGKGHNTDTVGFRTCGIDFSGRDVLILGAGGTARMMAREVSRAGAKTLTVCARRKIENVDRVDNVDISMLSTLSTFSKTVLLNATPLGMWPCAWEMPCVEALLRPGVEVFDAVYNPTPTRLVLNARKHGATASGGLRMLVRQAIESQKIWNPEKTFDTDAIESAILPEVSRELLRHSPMHILLTGFMGAGKSSLARELATRLGVACVDVDAEIEAQTGRAISDLFERDGEAAFRAIERDIARQTLTRNRSSVVAAGGGLTLSKENQTMIRQTNTLALHLEAPFETLWQRVRLATNRPLLLKGRGHAECLFRRRRESYRFFSDLILDATQPLQQLAANTLARLTHTGDPHDPRP